MCIVGKDQGCVCVYVCMCIEHSKQREQHTQRPCNWRGVEEMKGQCSHCVMNEGLSRQWLGELAYFLA